MRQLGEALLVFVHINVLIVYILATHSRGVHMPLSIQSMVYMLNKTFP